MDVVAEISALGELMSPNEVVAALTKNAAAYLDLSDSIGTLEPGKTADIVVIDGDRTRWPTYRIWRMAQS